MFLLCHRNKQRSTKEELLLGFKCHIAGEDAQSGFTKGEMFLMYRTS